MLERRSKAGIAQHGSACCCSISLIEWTSRGLRRSDQRRRIYYILWYRPTWMLDWIMHVIASVPHPPERVSTV